MKKRTKALLIILLCTLFTSFGQVLLKAGANSLSPTLQGTLLNISLIIGILFYIIAAGLLILAMKYKELSFVYPIIATSYIWVSLLAAFFFNEPLSTLKWLGILTILLGVIFIGLGGGKK